jgi:hypothetical protein
MNYFVSINDIKKVDELKDSWTDADLKALLVKFNYADADQLKPHELKEYLFMAVADYEPNEAAKIVLEYKLSDILEEGQIDNLSHEMLREKVSENYSDISLHKGLFEVNQLLFKAYNGKFPLTHANVITFRLKSEKSNSVEVSKEIALRALSAGLKDSNLIHRLFEDPLQGKIAFPEAQHILWELKTVGDNQYEIITSEKWIEKDDFKSAEFEATVIPFEDEEE